MQEPNNVFSAFEVAGAQTQKDIDAMLDDGSTGVHCFLDPISGAFYTSTLGDSEAFLYRKNKSNIGKIIPLSCVRKWDSKYDSIRLALGKAALSLETLDPLIAAKKIQDVVGKCRTKYRLDVGDFARVNTGIAVSRSYGDNTMFFKVKTDSESTDSESIKVKIIIQKTKITGLHVGSGDIVIIVSDGFTDYVNAGEMVKLIEDCTDLDQLADQLATYAKSTKHSHDDVTVLVGYIS
jgi:hypothetical protein